MFKDKEVADNIVKMMVEIHADLVETVNYVKDKCDDNEFVLYRKKVGKIMGSIFVDIMNPIFQKYPDLNPEGKQKP